MDAKQQPCTSDAQHANTSRLQVVLGLKTFHLDWEAQNFEFPHKSFLWMEREEWTIYELSVIDESISMIILYSISVCTWPLLMNTPVKFIPTLLACMHVASLQIFSAHVSMHV